MTKSQTIEEKKFKWDVDRSGYTKNEIKFQDELLKEVLKDIDFPYTALSHLIRIASTKMTTILTQTDKDAYERGRNEVKLKGCNHECPTCKILKDQQSSQVR